MSVDPSPVCKRYHYTAKTKRNVIQFAEKFGNREAAREFNIDESNIRRWRKNVTSINLCMSTRKAFTGPTSGRHPELEEEVRQYIIETRGKCLPVTRRSIVKKASEVAAVQGIQNFKASNSWCTRFMIRQGFSLRRRTSVCQKLPPQFEEKLVSFQRYVMKLRTEVEYDFCQMGNADETPVYFDMVRNTTVERVGAKEVKLRCTGYEKQRITVMLGITADGHKLPPFLILKRKTIPKNEKFPNDVIIRANQNGWMTADLMTEWIRIVWHRRPGGLRRPRNMLVLDAFKGHLTDSVKEELKRSNTDLVIIPGGMTSQLQPLDVSVNKPFKSYLHQAYDEWLLTDNLPMTPSGKIKRASASTVAGWVSWAWRQIPSDMVEKSFKKCCISNALDGSEDDLLWEDSSNEDDVSDTDSDGCCDSDSDATPRCLTATT